jgi:hypothetical protein
MNNENIVLISIIVLMLILVGIYIFVNNQNKNKNKKEHRKGGCNGTRWGCCPDGNTPARGRNNKGC